MQKRPKCNLLDADLSREFCVFREIFSFPAVTIYFFRFNSRSFTTSCFKILFFFSLFLMAMLPSKMSSNLFNLFVPLCGVLIITVRCSGQTDYRYNVCVFNLKFVGRLTITFITLTNTIL